MFVEIQKEYLDPKKCPLPFVLCTFGKNLHQGATTRANGFIYHHVLWVKRGKGKFTAGEDSFTLSEGEGFFCKREIPHSYEQDGEAFQTVWITFLCMEGILEYYALPDWFSFKVTPILARFSNELEALCTGNSTVISRSVIGYTWITDWLTQLREPYISTATIVRQYLENHFSDPLTLDDIAEHAHFSRYALCHYYQKECGVSIMEQLKKIRIAKAKQLLRYSQYHVGEIGHMCGYDSTSYFGKLFREQTGQSPNEYRALHNR